MTHVSDLWLKFIDTFYKWIEDFSFFPSNTPPTPGDVGKGFITQVIYIVFTPISDITADVTGDLVNLPFLDTFFDLLLPIIGRYSMFDLMLGGAIAFYLCYTIVKWVVGIITGS